MKITHKGDYALKAVLDLALHYEQELVASSEMAKRIDAPVKFLEQILLDLKKGGIIRSRRGVEGGYLLSKAPAQIAVGDVIRLIEGPIEPIACVNEGYANCEDLRKCVFRDIFQRVFEATADIIDNITFEDLVLKINSRQQVLTYSI
ncbi:MAG TPA: Rrf2 family transcriptional regulator [Candidatus Omnitrophota bacterium]|nr:Rrf2 family transcriptional regulator [Candidatus Omnitrophota bacterium]